MGKNFLWLHGLPRLSCRLALTAVIVFLGISCRSFAEQTNAPLRLAIIPLDDASSTRAVLDLLTAQFSAQSNLHVIERAEIKRILDEQWFSTSGLIATQDRIQVGRLLRAGGLLFLQQDARVERLRARLVETRQGFQAAQWTYGLTSGPLPEVALNLGREVLQALPKLSLSPANRLLVSVVHVNNATLSTEFLWIEDELPLLLGAYLSRDPRVLLLERRQMAELLAEADRGEGPGSEFWSAGVLVDGELALTTGQAIDVPDKPVTFVVRLRSADQRDLATVREAGLASQLEDIAARAAEAAATNLAALGPQTEGRRAEEAKAFFALARRQGLAWAAGAAIALDATNAAASVSIITSLVSHAFSRSTLTDPRDKDRNTMERVNSFVQATELCRAANNQALRKAFYKQVMAASFNTLDAPFIISTVAAQERVNEILRPVGAFLRLAIEEDYAVNRLGARYLLGHCVNRTFTDPIERVMYMQAMIGRFLNDTNRPAAEGLHTVLEMLSHAPSDIRDGKDAVSVAPIWEGVIEQRNRLWIDLFTQLSRRPEPELQFTAFARMHRIVHRDHPEKARYADEALARLPAVLTNTAFLLYTRRQQGGNNFLTAGLSDIRIPAKQTIIREEMRRGIMAALDSQGIAGLAAMDLRLYEPYLSDDAKRALAEKALPLCDQKDATATVPRNLISRMQYTLTQWRDKLRIDPPAQAGQTSAPSSRILFTPDDRHFAQIVENHRPLRRKIHRQRKVDLELLKDDRLMSYVATNHEYLTPQRLLVEENTLWIGLGEGPEWEGVGLIEFDLRQGQPRSIRVGHVSCDLSMTYLGMDNKRPMKAAGLASLVRWRDFICLGQANYGVYLFPAGQRAFSTDLAGVWHLTKEDGLPSLTICGLVSMGGELFIAVSQAIVRWDAKDESIQLIGTTESQDGPNSGINSSIVALSGDATNSVLQTLVSYGAGRQVSHDLWQCRTGSNVWSLLATNITAQHSAWATMLSPPLPAELPIKNVVDWARYGTEIIAITKESGGRWAIKAFSPASDAPQAASAK